MMSRFQSLFVLDQMKFLSMLTNLADFGMFIIIHFLLFDSTKWVKVNGVLYKPCSAVVLDAVNDSPVFGLIKSIYVIQNTVFLYVQILSTRFFNRHYYSYVIEHTTEYKLLVTQNVLLPNVFHIRRLIVNNSPSLCIVPKFHIAGTLQI